MIDVARIQTGTNAYTNRVIVAPRDGDTVLLDACPHGTIDVYSFRTVKEAAAYMKCSETTVRRQQKQAEAE